MFHCLDMTNHQMVQLIYLMMFNPEKKNACQIGSSLQRWEDIWHAAGDRFQT